jgi:hypothetical protein
MVSKFALTYDLKRIRLKRGTAVLALCDLGAKDLKEDDMLGIACSDAQAILFCFDLTQRSSLLALQALFVRTTQVGRNKLLSFVMFDFSIHYFAPSPPSACAPPMFIVFFVFCLPLPFCNGFLNLFRYTLARYVICLFRLHNELQPLRTGTYRDERKFC